MEADGRDSEAEEVGASDAVWPPPPSGATPSQPKPRSAIWLIHLTLSPFLTQFGLPKWAKSALTNILVLFGAFPLERHAPLVSKIMVGFLMALYTLFLFLMAWVVSAALLLVARGLIRTNEVSPPKLGKDIISAVGGRMGLVPILTFYVWGCFYLAGNHFHLVNRAVLMIWVIWFVLGCGVALVNCIGQWIRKPGANTTG